MGCSVTPLDNLYLWLFLFSLLLGGASGAWVEALFRHLLIKWGHRDQKRRRRVRRPRGAITLALFLAVAASAVLLASVLLLDFSGQPWSRELLLFAAPLLLIGGVLAVGRKLLLLPVMVILLLGALQLRSEFSSALTVRPDLVLEEIQINLVDQRGLSFETGGTQKNWETESGVLSIEAVRLKPEKLLFFLPSCGYIRLTSLSGFSIDIDKPFWPGTFTGRIIDRLGLWQVETIHFTSGPLLSFTDYYLKIDLKADKPELYLIPADADS